MPEAPLPAIVGLTGGIASGKSTVTGMMRALGVCVLDADVIARDVVAAGQPALEEIRQAFGQGVLTPEGELDRQALGALIFAKEGARETLNRITHPRIALEMMEGARQAGAKGHAWVVYDAALLVENQAQLWLQALVVVTLDVKVQLERLMARDGITREAAQARIDAQLPLAQKVAVADYVIDNGGELEDTEVQVEAVIKALEGRFGQK